MEPAASEGETTARGASRAMIGTETMMSFRLGCHRRDTKHLAEVEVEVGAEVVVAAAEGAVAVDVVVVVVDVAEVAEDDTALEAQRISRHKSMHVISCAAPLTHARTIGLTDFDV